MAENIPQHFIDFCAEVSKLAAKYDFNSLSIGIRPGYSDKWRDQVTAVWQQGRHGEDSREVQITSTVNVRHVIPKDSTP